MVHARNVSTRSFRITGHNWQSRASQQQADAILQPSAIRAARRWRPARSELILTSDKALETGHSMLVKVPGIALEADRITARTPGIPRRDAVGF